MQTFASIGSGRFARMLATMLLSASLSACAGTMQIGSILDDPAQYDGESVRVSGEVTQALGVPAVGGGYRIDDGTGTLMIVSRRGAPRVGANVAVRGTFRSIFTLGDQSLSVLEEDDRETR